VAKPFDAYSPAITATKKAIEDREAKLAELKEAEEISNSEERFSDFYYQFGRAEMAIELEIGDQKVAKKKLNCSDNPKYKDTSCSCTICLR
jgi:hypothetical protein